MRWHRCVLVCLVLGMGLASCGGSGAQQRDEELATLRARQELLMLFTACGDPAKEQLLSELAPELGLKAKCDNWRTKQIVSQATEERSELALEEKANAFYVRAFEEEPGDEPWASEAAVEVLRIYEAYLASNAYRSRAKGPDCDLPDPYIKCGTVLCSLRVGPPGREREDCVNTLMSIPRESDFFENNGSSQGGEYGIVIHFIRKGYEESDVLTLGWEAVLADEPRDETWAVEAEKILVTTAKQNASSWREEGCDAGLLPECRTVTCRVTLPAAQGSGCMNVFRDVWPSHGPLATSRSIDGTQRVFYLVREGFVFPDALTLSK